MSIDDRQFSLSNADKVSQTWQKLKPYLEQLLADARGRNDGENLDQIQTAIIRGRIQTLKQLIKLGDIPPVDFD